MIVVSKKARLKLDDEIDLLKTLSDIDLEFGDAYYQHDRILLPRNYRGGVKLPRMILRTIIPDGKDARYRLIMKRETGTPGANSAYSVRVTDYASTVEMLQQLGFSYKGDIARRRQEIDMERGVMLYLDDVDGLGKYVKIEMSLKDGEEKTTDASEELTRIMQNLGIKEKAIITDSYRELLRKKESKNSPHQGYLSVK